MVFMAQIEKVLSDSDKSSSSAKETITELKKLSFNEIKELFEATMRSIKDFVLIESEDDKAIPKLAEARSSKRDADEELDQGRSKKQRIEQGMNVEALQTKYPIIDWEIYAKDTRKYWKIIRVGNHTEVYQFFDDMLKVFDSDDLV
nr:hypothetical protein [Tanacetum cinerariifolium]